MKAAFGLVLPRSSDRRSGILFGFDRSPVSLQAGECNASGSFSVNSDDRAECAGARERALWRKQAGNRSFVHLAADAAVTQTASGVTIHAVSSARRVAGSSCGLLFRGCRFGVCHRLRRRSFDPFAAATGEDSCRRAVTCSGRPLGPSIDEVRRLRVAIVGSRQIARDLRGRRTVNEMERLPATAWPRAA